MPGPRVAKLDFLSAIDIRGADAAAFLHAQLCGDVLGLAPGRCRFTAWCTSRGRVIASFLLSRNAAGFRMLLCRDIAGKVAQKLGMYVLRSRVELVDRSHELAVAGWYGAPAAAAPVAGLEREWEHAEHGGLAAAGLPGPGGMRLLLCGAPPVLAECKATAEHVPGWILEDAQAGIPWIGMPLSEEFLPQELDLERLQGLSYTKGCFPGQEIIARVHSRGRLKRGLRAFTAGTTAPLPGTRIVTAEGADAGLVVMAERAAAGDSAGLAVSDLERTGRDPLYLDRPGGVPVRFDVRGKD